MHAYDMRVVHQRPVALDVIKVWCRFLLVLAALLFVRASFAQINVAAQANGGIATASTAYYTISFDTTTYTFAPEGAIDGDRKGQKWGAGGGWNDATPGAFPDWLQVNFSRAQTIGEIDVFTVQDNYTSPVEPTASMTFTRYGITQFQVQYWDGASWVDVPGASASDNKLVWRRFTFAPITTDRIRVIVNAAVDNYSRIVEVEAWTADAAPAVALSTPANNAMLPAPATVTLAAIVSVSVESVSKVEFYRDGTLIGTSTGAMSGAYTFIDKGLGVGSYSYTAKLYGNASPARVSESTARLVTVSATPAGAVNVAAQSNGGNASASTAFSGTFGGVAYTFPASAVNNGERKGVNWGSGGGWNDGTIGEFPDWLQVNFNGVQTIGEIDVVTVQDDYTAPVEPSPSMTFGRYGITDFQVQYWNGSAWLDVPGGNVTGNNLVWRRFPFAPITTDRIRVLVNGALENYSRIIEVEAWTAAAAPVKSSGAKNVAAQVNGGTASASSTYNGVGGESTYTFPESGAIDGDRKGLNWGSGGGWNDATPSAFPDWLQVTFSGSQTIGEIDVFTVQDNYTAPVEPTAGMTFARYGITDFQVQYWNGSAWLDVPGGNVTGNNLVWRRLTFAPITTDRIRVVVNAALETYSRIIEVEAWTAVTASPASQQIYFIHTDHLNTPRVITNAAGQAVWRWDNLDPFGANAPDENPSGLGTFTCNLRFPGQYFDRETNLHYNYFRDYDPMMGRYVESDPIGLLGGMNPYAYPLTPLNLVDVIGFAPNGRMAPNTAAGAPLSFLALAVFAPIFPYGEYKGVPRTACGADGGLAFPNTFDGVLIEDACAAHDECYGKSCGVSRATCDRDFLNRMRQACGNMPRCLVGAYSYYSVVRWKAEETFLKAREWCRNGRCGRGNT